MHRAGRDVVRLLLAVQTADFSKALGGTDSSRIDSPTEKVDERLLMLKNHPRGLLVLFFTEMWERFGFYTMMAIYVLYMDEKLGWDDARKGNFYGWFLGAVYFIPIAGGWLGDRVLGHRNAIRIGTVLMTAGYLALALSSRHEIASFYAGLILVAAGTGVFKANISVMVGNLYEDGSPLKDSGFNIFYMGINLGATLAPLAATLFHNIFDSYNISFAAAAVGMVFSMVIFQVGTKHLIPAPIRPPIAPPLALKNNPAGSSSEDRQRIATLVTLFSIVIFFWLAFYQNGFALTLFAQRSTRLYDVLKPETYQFFGPFFILALTPLLVAAFGRMRERGKEPSSASKIFAGMFIAGLSLLIMVFAALTGGDLDHNIMSPLWLISSYFVVTVAEILVSPMGLSFVSKVAPRRISGLMMGCWFGATAVGSYGSGLLGRFYSTFSHHNYFLIIAALLFLSSFLVLMSLNRLNRFSG
jgi:proton-dependent oligopeptide transporter, POT family